MEETFRPAHESLPVSPNRLYFSFRNLGVITREGSGGHRCATGVRQRVDTEFTVSANHSILVGV
jgi:hypothetical protein